MHVTLEVAEGTHKLLYLRLQYVYLYLHAFFLLLKLLKGLCADSGLPAGAAQVTGWLVGLLWWLLKADTFDVMSNESFHLSCISEMRGVLKFDKTLHILNFRLLGK